MNGTEVVEMERILQAVRATFGAPGDWGYKFPIGKALLRLYRERTPEALEALLLVTSTLIREELP